MFADNDVDMSALPTVTVDVVTCSLRGSLSGPNSSPKAIQLPFTCDAPPGIARALP
jgi:hypothetical protein